MASILTLGLRRIYSAPWPLGPYICNSECAPDNQRKWFLKPDTVQPQCGK
jgi:hypothetical protein